MIDSHAHWSSGCDIGVWAKDIDTVILAGTNINDSKQNIELAKKYLKIKAAVGIHPENILRHSGLDPESASNNISDPDFHQDDELRKLIQSNKKSVVAIGECGLDAMVASNQEILNFQIPIFKKQIELAIEFDLPLIIHARKMNDEIIEILLKYPKHRGVFHCYTGGKKRIKKILDLGDWYFGIDGNITYEMGLEEVVKEIPRGKLLLETDCPYLTPVPYRGEENKPAYVKYIYEKVADIWGMSFREVEAKVDCNVRKLFADPF